MSPGPDGGFGPTEAAEIPRGSELCHGMGMALPALCCSHGCPGGGRGWSNCFCAFPSTAATDTMTATSAIVPTVTVTATTVPMQSRAWWGSRQQHLHGVRWGHGGFPGQTPTWDSARGGRAGQAAQRAEPGNGAVPGLAAPRGRRVPRSRGSCGWGGWGHPPKGRRIGAALSPWGPGAGGARWGSRWSLPRVGALLGAHGTSWPPAHRGEPAPGSLPRV